MSTYAELAGSVDEVLEHLDDHTNPAWKKLAYHAIGTLAKNHEKLTCDEVWIELEKYDSPPVHNKKALGIVMRKAQTDGLIKATPNYVPSSLIGNHAAIKRVWESLVWEGKITTKEDIKECPVSKAPATPGIELPS